VNHHHRTVPAGMQVTGALGGVSWELRIPLHESP
jgi:hypothetical protein